MTRGAVRAAASSSNATKRWCMMTRTMPENQMDAPVRHIDVLIRDAVLAQIEDRLAGRIDNSALAAWAFDRFYAHELGYEDYEAGAEVVIAEVLDDLMFDDAPRCLLDQEELRALIARLEKL